VRLRRTLVSLQIALVAAGLVVFGFTSYQLYRQSEVQRIHTQLVQTDLPALEMALCQQQQGSSTCPGDFGAGRVGAGVGAGASATSADGCPVATDRFFVNNLTPGSFAELLTSSGQRLARLYIPFAAAAGATGPCPAPDLPTSIKANSSFTVRATKGPGPFLVDSATVTAISSQPGRPGSGETERGAPGQTAADSSAPGSSTAAASVAAGSATVIVVGVPLDVLQASLHRLLIVDLIVGAVLLVALAAGSLVLIRRSLRPLERMAATSRAISAGDLSRRVTANDERSEVGQLGAALNGMLTRIEGAFDERDATEARLRQFLADASHELRTPLTSIRGYAELWRLGSRPPSGPATTSDAVTTSDPATTSGPTPSSGPATHPGGGGLDADAAMARIEEHAERMGELIEELLLLARLDESRPMQTAAVDLAVVAAEACDDAAALQPGRPISLDVGEDVVVDGELSHLRRAVANLMTNAVRHTPPGSPIEVKVDRSDGVARVVVRDHGPGMSEAGLTHAFDRFWQADASRATGGSGLGLAIVAGVAAEHGGRATVDNDPEGGAVLTLRLPLPSPANPSAGPGAAAGSPAPPVDGAAVTTTVRSARPGTSNGVARDPGTRR
jgi:two-component system OmpR family sensor kinase